VFHVMELCSDVMCVFGSGDSNREPHEHEEFVATDLTHDRANESDAGEDSNSEPRGEKAVHDHEEHHESAKGQYSEDSNGEPPKALQRNLSTGDEEQDEDSNLEPHDTCTHQDRDVAKEGQADSNGEPIQEMQPKHRECAKEEKEVSNHEPQDASDADDPHVEKATHCGDDDDAGELNLKPCEDEKEILQGYADSKCMHCAMQKVMVEPIEREDVVEDSNPRPSGHVCKVCTPIMEVDEFEKSTDKDVLDTTHRNDIGVWEVDQDPPDLMETAHAGCMRSPRQGSFGRVQFQGETPGQGKCCWMQQCNDFSWVPWYKDILQWYQPKNSSQVKRLTRQQQKRCDLLSYSLMIIFVLSNVVLESTVAGVSSVSMWNFGPDNDAGIFDLQRTLCGVNERHGRTVLATKVVLGEHRSLPKFWPKDDNCGSVMTTDNGFEEEDTFLQSDSVLRTMMAMCCHWKHPRFPSGRDVRCKLGIGIRL